MTRSKQSTKERRRESALRLTDRCVAIIADEYFFPFRELYKAREWYSPVLYVRVSTENQDLDNHEDYLWNTVEGLGVEPDSIFW